MMAVDEEAKLVGILPIIGIATAVIAVYAVLVRTFALGRRAYNQDGRYLVSVRYPGQWHDIRSFVQPNKLGVVALYSDVGPDVWGCLDLVCRNISYRQDIGEFWQFPSETIWKGIGDCEDTSILLTSLLRNFTDAYVALGSYQGYGHAWTVSKEGEILEATYTEARHVPDPEDYCPYVLFSDQEVIELWPGALSEVFELRRDEATKLNLIAAVLADGSSNPGDYRYAGLPQACICHECGYTVTNPGVHCPQLGECPICHAPRLWRL